MTPLNLQNIAVFVNTSDGFADCWQPFFRLFERYAGSLRALPVFLNTERRDHIEPGLSLTTTKVWPTSEGLRPTWSECLDRGLLKVPCPYVFYFQEDYFLTTPVVTSMIQAAVDILDSDHDVGVVYLNRYGPQFNNCKFHSKDFVRILTPARYLVSTQAAIWRRDFLRSLIRPWESGWMFEKFASQRVRRSHTALISVSPQVMKTAPVIDYVYTGVIKGRWKHECVGLFKKHGISVDVTERGLYREAGRWKSRIEVARKLIEHPARTLRSLLTLVAP